MEDKGLPSLALLSVSLTV
jgi:hypothetical protein